jgi:hypothetical protein
MVKGVIDTKDLIYFATVIAGAFPTHRWWNRFAGGSVGRSTSLFGLGHRPLAFGLVARGWPPRPVLARRSGFAVVLYLTSSRDNLSNFLGNAHQVRRQRRRLLADLSRHLVGEHLAARHNHRFDLTTERVLPPPSRKACSPSSTNRSGVPS